MTHHDAIVCGAGVIGLSLALELRKRGLRVLILERAAPGGESSHAAAGMLACCAQEAPESHPHRALHALAEASYRMYPGFVRAVETASGMKVDLRREGTLQLLDAAEPLPSSESSRVLAPGELARLEPRIAGEYRAVLLNEATLDPRALCVALERAARHDNIDLATGSPVTSLRFEAGKLTGVRTDRAEYAAPIVVNCCGAWSAELESVDLESSDGTTASTHLPTRPMKGQMLSVVGAVPVVRHTICAHNVYLVPRTDGRLLIGATVEDVGFDKRVVPEAIQRLHQAAADLIPDIGEMKIHEAWAGLRPATPDDLPILGPTSIPGYFVATGHFRDGILLAPITARVMADLITGAPPAFDLAPFSPDRFAK
ncbi:MAG: glycine oxidase ThiO [Candidatus Koribacter versatilis]|uniref:Glycine oxidase ThiO n=1 Tax=Candidatus Korobacter versatilis TaxID=658062 RepID=A0A932A6V9_9BACT|nr:glycine oxidase ThiO [Candidatus Koribacter versatilis]